MVSRNREAVIELFRAFKPNLIYGYSSAVGELASLVGESLKGQMNRLVAVVTSEVLAEDTRSRIQSCLASQVFNLYGAQEGCHLNYARSEAVVRG